MLYKLFPVQIPYVVEERGEREGEKSQTLWLPDMHGSQPAQLKCLLKENIDTLLVQVWDDQRKTPPKTQPENCVNIQKHP